MVEIIESAARDAVERARLALEDGGVVLVPTDTVYGLAVSPLRDDAAVRLFAIKRRPRSTNLPVMVASGSGLETLGVAVTAKARLLLASDLVPGPLTVVMGFSDSGPVSWLEGRKEVAIRMPAEPFMLELLDAAGPLLVTSANLHDHPTMGTVPKILDQLILKPGLAVDGGRREAVPSTLVNCTVDPPAIEREGVVDHARIREILA